MFDMAKSEGVPPDKEAAFWQQNLQQQAFRLGDL